MPRGILFVISAPSGGGKSTICRRLLQRRAKDLKYSTSCTTRAPRAGEKHGKHYFFLSKEEFKRKIQRGEFLEWAVVHENYYGTPRGFVESQTKDGVNLLLAIDVQGAASIRRKVPEAVLIFITPPSMESLRERLAGRRDEAESITKRLAAAKTEMAAAKNFDYMVVNDDLDQAVAQIECILTAESLRVSRQEASELACV